MHPWHSLGGLERGKIPLQKPNGFCLLFYSIKIYIQRKKGAENHHVIETYKCIILQCPRHLMVTREVLICTSEGHWRGLPVYFTVLIRHQKHSGCQVRMEVLSNKLPLTSKLYCGVNCRRTKGGNATPGLPIRTPSESSPLIRPGPCSALPGRR